MNALPDDFDPFTETADSMLALYRDAHAQGCPVMHSTAHGGFDMTMTYAETKQAATDWETFSSANGVTLPRFPLRNVAIEHDPPEHTYWSGVYREILSVRAMRAAEEAIRADAIRLIDAFAGRGHADLVAELTKIVPGNAICRLLGIIDPDTVTMGCRLGVDLAEAMFDPQLVAVAFAAFGRFVMGEIGARRQHSRNDFLSRLANDEILGHRLTDDEIMGIATGFFIAGHETTTAGLSALFYQLATDPQLRARLIADGTLIPRAGEEALRLETPLHGFLRTTTRDVQVAGTSIAAGSEVWLNYQAANRDPAMFEEPEQFRPERRPNPHLAFGQGIHTCTGAPLARIELRVVTEELLRRVPDVSLSGGPVTRRRGGFNIVSISALPVVFTPTGRPTGAPTDTRRETRGDDTVVSSVPEPIEAPVG